MTLRFRLGVASLVAVAAALAAGGAFAQSSELTVAIRGADLSADGTTKLVVSVVGSAVANTTLNKGNFTVTEAGQQVQGFEVAAGNAAAVQQVAVALVMDVSGSTAGQPIADAKSAARTFVSRLPDQTRIALISFSDRPTTRVGFTTDKARVLSQISALTAGGGTALYDAVVQAGTQLTSLPSAQHNIVVFSDGADTARRSTLSQAQGAAKAAKAPLTAVGLVTSATDQNALNALAASVKGGRSVRVGQSAQLASAFTQVAREISNQYVISYVSDRKEPKNLDISVSAKVGALAANDSSTVLNPRTGEKPSTTGATGPSVYKSRAPIGFFASKTGYYVGIGSVFAAVLMFLGVMLYAPQKGRAATVLQRGLRLYSRGERKKAKQREEGFLSGTAVGRRAVELVDKVPRSEAFEARLQTLLERGAIPLRATEFFVIQIVGAAVGAIIGFGLLGRLWLGFVLLVGGGIIPRLVLAQRVAKREATFLSQLPDVLQLLSGSLQAGYGFMQAIDTVAKEATPPASVEFSRVLAESRLGMPVEDALNAMAERVGGDDFRWVVLAINIQRQVGGNLAALLTTVAATLREREMVRRQIKVLSAEGRLSAMILVALPFVLAGYISVVNPGYINRLFDETVGKIMVAGGIVLMGIGMLWMRKIIKIDV
jgi:tight adherence protein B